MSERNRVLSQRLLKSLVGPGAADPDVAARAARIAGADPAFASWFQGRQIFPQEVPVPADAPAIVLLPEMIENVLGLMRSNTSRQPLAPRLAPDVMPEPSRPVSAQDAVRQLDMGGGAATVATPEDNSAAQQLFEEVLRRYAPADVMPLQARIDRHDVPMPQATEQWVFQPGMPPVSANPRPFYTRGKQTMETVTDPATGASVEQPLASVRISYQDPVTGNSADGFILGDAPPGSPNTVYDETGNPVGAALYQPVNEPLSAASDLANQQRIQPLADQIRQVVQSFDRGEGIHPATIRRIDSELRNLSPNFEPVLEQALGVDFSERHLDVNPLTRFKEIAQDPAGAVNRANQARITSWQKSLEDMEKEPGWWAQMLGPKQPGATPADALSATLADARARVAGTAPPAPPASSEAAANFRRLQEEIALLQQPGSLDEVIAERQDALAAAEKALADYEQGLALRPRGELDVGGDKQVVLNTEPIGADYRNRVWKAKEALQEFLPRPAEAIEAARAARAQRMTRLGQLQEQLADAKEAARRGAEEQMLSSDAARSLVYEDPAVQAAIAAVRTPPPPRPAMRPATIEVQPDSPDRPTVGAVEDADRLLLELGNDTQSTPDNNELALTPDEAAAMLGVPKNRLPPALAGSKERRPKAVTGSHDVVPSWEKEKGFPAAIQWQERLDALYVKLNEAKQQLADAKAGRKAGDMLVSKAEIAKLEQKVAERREAFNAHKADAPTAPWSGSEQGATRHATEAFFKSAGSRPGQGMKFLGRHPADLNATERAVNANEIAAMAEEGLSPGAEAIIRESLERVGGPEANKLQAADVSLKDYDGINPTGMSNPQNNARARGAEAGAFESRVNKAAKGPIAERIRANYQPQIEAADAKIAEIRRRLEELPAVQGNRKFSLSEDEFYGGMPNMGDDANPVFAKSFDSNEIVWPDGVRTDWNGDLIDPVHQELTQAMAARRQLDAEVQRELDAAFFKRPRSLTVQQNPLSFPAYRGGDPERVTKAARLLVKYAPAAYPSVENARAAIQSEIGELGGSPLMVAVDRFARSYDIPALYRTPEGQAAAAAIQSEANRIREVFGGQKRMSFKETDDGIVATEQPAVQEMTPPKKPAPTEDGAKGEDVGEIQSVDGKPAAGGSTPATPAGDGVPPRTATAPATPSTPAGDAVPPRTAGAAETPGGSAPTQPATTSSPPKTPRGQGVPRRNAGAAPSAASEPPPTSIGSMWTRLKGMLGLGPRTPDGTPVPTPATPAPPPKTAPAAADAAAAGGAGGGGKPPVPAVAAGAEAPRPKRGGGKPKGGAAKDKAVTQDGNGAAGAAAGDGTSSATSTPRGDSPTSPEKPAGTTTQSQATGKGKPKTYAGGLASKAKRAVVKAGVAGVAGYAGVNYLVTPSGEFVELPAGERGGNRGPSADGSDGILLDGDPMTVPVASPAQDITVEDGGPAELDEIQRTLSQIRGNRGSGGRRSYQILGSMH